MKTITIDFIVYLFEDTSVGIMGGYVPVSIQIPADIYPDDMDERREMLDIMKQGLLQAIDPEGICRTKVEDDEYWDARNAEVPE